MSRKLIWTCEKCKREFIAEFDPTGQFITNEDEEIRIHFVKVIIEEIPRLKEYNFHDLCSSCTQEIYDQIDAVLKPFEEK